MQKGVRGDGEGEGDGEGGKGLRVEGKGGDER